MKCKEHISQPPFTQFGQAKEIKPSPFASGGGLFGGGAFQTSIENKAFYDDEHSLMKSCGFCQNSMNMWNTGNNHNNNSNLFLTSNNLGFGGKVTQNQVNLSPYQLINGFDNSNMFPLFNNSQIMPFSKVAP